MTRDQMRAHHAYACVAQVPVAERDDYRVLVHAFGPNVMRSGLAAALTFVEREKGKRQAADRFLGHLGSAGVPGLEGAGAGVASRVRDWLDTEDYMLATRELLAVSVWLKRAVQAGFPEEP